MTGRDLIVYILTNQLEDKPIFHNGRLMGFATVDELAAKLGVGKATIHAMVSMDRIDYICIGDALLFPATTLNNALERNNSNE